uniref:Uncharacterized protein n=1 Tax=Steinernema glaseri TaxID=37863 RepID=A0A1I7YZW2_9BILA
MRRRGCRHNPRGEAPEGPAEFSHLSPARLVLDKADCNEVAELETPRIRGGAHKSSAAAAYMPLPGYSTPLARPPPLYSE